ncbi:MAG: DUF4262 domain-containing protein [Candidatus Nanopelagicales bacterium]
MCDDPSLTVADLRAEMFRTIERFGWMVQYVEAEPGFDSFAYTVGLAGRGLPELHVTGLSAPAAATLLNHAARELTKGGLGPCDIYTGPEGHEYLLGQMVDVGDLLGAIEVYGPDIDALNLTPY